jgi:hypothetical protein
MIGHTMSKRRRRILLLLLIALAASASTYAWYHHWRNDTVPLPELDEIVEMRVDVGGMNRAISNWDDKKDERLKFIVPRDHWRGILDSLRPYHRAQLFLEKGYVPGELRIKLQTGNEFMIVILLLSADEVFFWIGPKGSLHAGGDKRKLYAALKAAAAAGEPKHKPK